MKTKELIEKGLYKKIVKSFPGTNFPDKILYECQQCEGFRSGYKIQKKSILGHQRLYHSKEGGE